MDSKLQFRDLELVGEDAYPKLVLFKLMAYWQLLEILGVSITAVLGPWWAQFVKQHLGATITGKEERLLVAELASCWIRLCVAPNSVDHAQTHSRLMSPSVSQHGME
jgi:hypothetical protein